MKCVVAVGQEAVLESRASDDPIHVSNALRALCATLKHVESFYDMLGGVVEPVSPRSSSSTRRTGAAGDDGRRLANRRANRL